MRRLLSIVLCALAVSQTALPIAHEWRVARDESGQHLEASSGPAYCEPERAHRHHDHDCAVCPQISRLSSAVVSGRVSGRAPSLVVSKLSIGSRANPRAPRLDGASSRGPPALAS